MLKKGDKMKKIFNFEGQKKEGKELRPIPGFGGYLVSRDGQVFSSRSGHFLQPAETRRKGGSTTYLCCLLIQNRKKKYVYVHRLVAMTYLAEFMFPHCVVHHRNGDGRCNYAENLQIMTRTEHSRLIMSNWFLENHTNR